MQKTVFSIIVLLLLLSFAGCRSRKPSVKADLSVEILSYNVRNCKGMDDITDYKRISGIIRRINPDIVALQELDSATRRNNGIVVLDTLAALTGMYPVYGASIDYQGGKYGIGFLTNEKPLGWRRVPLPGREEERSLLIIELEKVIAGCTHFSLNEDDRLASVGIINESFSGYDKPVLLAGDFNAVPGSTVIESLKESWIILNDTSAATFPSDRPARCIDYIMGFTPSGLFATERANVVQEPVASDHLPLWVSVKVGK